MLPAPAKVPEFHKPEEKTSPRILNLLNDRVYEENGIQYAEYKPLNAGI